MRTAFDLIFRNARTRASAIPLDIGIAGGRIAAIAPQLACEAAEIDVGGRLVLPGFVDTHIHLDKARLLGRCGHDHASVSEAVAAVAAMKREFTVDDIYARGAKVIERAVVHGTTRMRTHVEIDPRIGLRGFEAIKALKHDYAWAIDLSPCVFPQEGLTKDPGAEELLVAALRDGGEAIGGCPYMDTDPNAHLERIFDLAQQSTSTSTCISTSTSIRPGGTWRRSAGRPNAATITAASRSGTRRSSRRCRRRGCRWPPSDWRNQASPLPCFPRPISI
jgi:cytosine/creatinine deaminase